MITFVLSTIDSAPHDELIVSEKLISLVSFMLETADANYMKFAFDILVQNILDSINLFKQFPSSSDFCIYLQNYVGMTKLNLIFLILSLYPDKFSKCRYNLLAFIAQMFNYEMMPRSMLTFYDNILMHEVHHNNLYSLYKI